MFVLYPFASEDLDGLLLPTIAVQKTIFRKKNIIQIFQTYFGFVVFGLVSFGYFFVYCQGDFYNLFFTIFSGNFFKNFSGMFLVLKLTFSNLKI